MVRNGTLQYIADTIAIESLASDLPIQKQADLFGDLGFSGVASSIVSKVKELLVPDGSPGGWVKAIGKFLIGGALFRAHWLLGVVYAAANAFGVDIIGIGKKVLSGVYDAIKGGANVVMSSVDQQGKIAVGMYNKDLSKKAFLFGKKKPSWSPRGGSKIEKMFGGLIRAGKTGKFKTLLVAIVIWALKTALLGAGIVGAAALVTSLIKPKKTEKVEPEVKPEAEPEVKPERPSLESVFDETKVPIGLTPSGRGTDIYRNEPGKFIWIVPVFGGIENTLLSWAKDVYEEFDSGTNEYDDIIYSSPAFRNMASKFKRNYGLGASSVRVPEGFTSRKQVVDTFVGDVSRKIKGMK